MALDGIPETIGVIAQGSGLRWSQVTIRYAQRIGAMGQAVGSYRAASLVQQVHTGPVRVDDRRIAVASCIG